MTLPLDFTEHALYSQSVLVGHNLGGNFTWNLPRQPPRADDIALRLHWAGGDSEFYAANFKGIFGSL